MASRNASNEMRRDRRLSAGDPTRTIHFALERFVHQLLRSRQKSSHDDSEAMSDMAWAIASPDTDPDLRASFTTAVNAAWGLAAFACLVAVVVVGIPVGLLLGDAAGNVVVDVLVAAGAFCLAGCANVLWRRTWYVPQARRRARDDGVESDRYAVSMRRTLPRNSSLIFQGAVGILILVLAIAS
jgi:hypothetical protein